MEVEVEQQQQLPWAKKQKLVEPELTGTVVVQFKKSSNDNVQENGLPTDVQIQLPNLDMPIDVTTLQLETVLNELLANEHKVPYSFYIDAEASYVDKTTKQKVVETEPIEIVSTLRDILSKHSLGTENVINIKYKPLSLFRVQPVTRCTDEMPGHTEAILHVQFSPDGESLASGGGDTTVRFWDVFTKTPRHVCREHKTHVLCTAWSPDGTRFVSGDKNGVIHVWDPKTGKPTLPKGIVGHKGHISSLAFEPMHRSISTDCLMLLSGSKDGTAKIWNVKNGRLVQTLTNHQGAIESVKWGGEGYLYTASRDKTICVWVERDVSDPHINSSPFKLTKVLEGHGHRINAIALSTDFLCRVGPFNHRGNLMRQSGNGLPEFVSLKEAALFQYQSAKKEFFGANASLPFERLVSCSDDFTLFFWHPTEDKKPIKRLLGHQQAVTHLNFSPDGRYLASASFDKKVKLWDGLTGNFLTTLSGHVGSVYQVVFSPDSRLIASASKDSTLKVWDIRDAKKAKHTLAEHYDEVYALDWSQNGKMIASGGKDRLLRIWIA